MYPLQGYLHRVNARTAQAKNGMPNVTSQEGCYPEQAAGGLKCNLRLVSHRIHDLVMAIHPGRYPGYAALVKPHFPLLCLPHTTTTASTSGLLRYVSIKVGITLCYHYYHCTVWSNQLHVAAPMWLLLIVYWF